MLKQIFLIVFLLSGCLCNAEIINPNLNFDDNEYDYIQGYRDCYVKNCNKKLGSIEYKLLVKSHKRDNTYPDNFYAVQAGYKTYKNNLLEPINLRNSNTLYMYAVQDINNKRITYYYTVFGNLKYIDIMYENYPNYPYVAKKYKKNGKLVSTLVCLNKYKQIKFNNSGSVAEIWENETLVKKIKF